MFVVVYLSTAFHKYCVDLFMTYLRASGCVVIAVHVMKYIMTPLILNLGVRWRWVCLFHTAS